MQLLHTRTCIMASPYRTANDENATIPMNSDAPTTMPNRRPLANVSTNPRVNSSVPGLQGKKVMQGSPLKRSFTAAVEGGQGFTYLKRRRLSEEQFSGQADGPVDSRTTLANVDAGHTSRSRSEPQHLVVRAGKWLDVRINPNADHRCLLQQLPSFRRPLQR